MAQAILSRGQKAAQTRRANVALREAEAAKAAEVKAANFAALKKRAAQNVIKTVPPKAARQASLARIAKAHKAVEADMLAAKALATQQAEIDRAEAEWAKMARHELRALAIGHALQGEAFGRRLARAYTRDFDGIDGGWWNATRADIDLSTNTGSVVAQLFIEQKVYFDNFKSNHAELVVRGLRRGKAQPARYWGLLKQYAEQDAAQGDDKGGKPAKRTPLEAMARDLPALYIRANGSPDFDAKGAKGEKLRDAAFKIGETLQLVLTKAQWADVQAKAEAKAAERG